MVVDETTPINLWILIGGKVKVPLSWGGSIVIDVQKKTFHITINKGLKYIIHLIGT